MYKDGDKIELGFQFEGVVPVAKTDPSFITKKKLTRHDDKILRYVALRIVDQLYANWLPDCPVDWAHEDAFNAICQDALVLGNFQGITCANGDTITALYMGPYNQIMAIVEVPDSDDTYDVFIC